MSRDVPIRAPWAVQAHDRLRALFGRYRGSGATGLWPRHLETGEAANLTMVSEQPSWHLNVALACLRYNQSGFVHVRRQLPELQAEAVDRRLARPRTQLEPAWHRGREQQGRDLGLLTRAGAGESFAPRESVTTTASMTAGRARLLLASPSLIRPGPPLHCLVP